MIRHEETSRQPWQALCLSQPSVGFPRRLRVRRFRRATGTRLEAHGRAGHQEGGAQQAANLGSLCPLPQ